MVTWNHRRAVGIPSSVSTTSQQQISQQILYTRWGSVHEEVLVFFNFITKMSPNPRTPVGERQQQRNNNATTTQQQSNNKTHKHGQGTLCSSVSCQGIQASSGVIWPTLASSGPIWAHVASSSLFSLHLVPLIWGVKFLEKSNGLKQAHFFM